MNPILLRIGLHPSKMARFIKSVKPPLPDGMKTKQRVEYMEAGLTAHGLERKRKVWVKK